jgi:arsenate reductase
MLLAISPDAGAKHRCKNQQMTYPERVIPKKNHLLTNLILFKAGLYGENKQDKGEGKEIVALAGMKQKVLFVGLYNAARSQMAEALLNHFYGDAFEACSAGLEPQKVSLLAVEVMRQQRIDISRKKTKWVYDFIKTGDNFDYVIIVCDKENAKRCPDFPGVPARLDWSFPDPSKFHGSHKEQIARTRQLRDDIKKKIDHWHTEPIAKSSSRNVKQMP